MGNNPTQYAGPCRPPCKTKKDTDNARSTKIEMYRWKTIRMLKLVRMVITRFQRINPPKGHVFEKVNCWSSPIITTNAINMIHRSEMANQSAIYGVSNLRIIIANHIEEFSVRQLKDVTGKLHLVRLHNSCAAGTPPISQKGSVSAHHYKPRGSGQCGP